MSQIGKQHALGKLTKAVSAKQDNRIGQYQKGRLKSTYTKAVRQISKDGKQANQCNTKHGTQSKTNDEATHI